jgi:hypothetical protein
MGFEIGHGLFELGVVEGHLDVFVTDELREFGIGAGVLCRLFA